MILFTTENGAECVVTKVHKYCNYTFIDQAEEIVDFYAYQTLIQSFYTV